MEHRDAYDAYPRSARRESLQVGILPNTLASYKGPVDVAGGFVFDEVSDNKTTWRDLENLYEAEQIAAKVVQFQPADIPAVFIVPESEPLTEQVDALLNDSGLSDPSRT